MRPSSPRSIEISVVLQLRPRVLIDLSSISHLSLIYLSCILAVDLAARAKGREKKKVELPICVRLANILLASKLVKPDK
jgi:hypothetical protein